jgi:hypothetical protein
MRLSLIAARVLETPVRTVAWWLLTFALFLVSMWAAMAVRA